MQPIYGGSDASRYLISAYSVWSVGARQLIPGLSCARLALPVLNTAAPSSRIGVASIHLIQSEPEPEIRRLLSCNGPSYSSGVAWLLNGPHLNGRNEIGLKSFHKGTSDRQWVHIKKSHPERRRAASVPELADCLIQSVAGVRRSFKPIMSGLGIPQQWEPRGLRIVATLDNIVRSGLAAKLSALDTSHGRLAQDDRGVGGPAT